MGAVYATLIINGLRTFASVPDIVKDETKAELLKRGYGTDGKKLPDDVGGD